MEHQTDNALPAQAELTRLFHRNDALTIFEIGSCDGTDAIRYAKRFPASTVFAFEPVPANYNKVLSNIAANDPGNIRAFALAMSTAPGEAEMHISSSEKKPVGDSDNAGNKSSSLLPPDKHLDVYPWCKFDTTIRVKTETIEHFCRTHNISTIDFIHLDVQGAELMVLKGAGEFLQHIRSIWLEVEHIALYKDQPLHHDVEKFMQDHGFVLRKFRVGGFSGDQFYVNARFLRERSGGIAYWFLLLQSWFLRSHLFIGFNRYLRKLKFFLKR